MVKEKRDIKSFQIKMDSQAHRLMKQRAQQLQVSIGELINNLLGSLEIRLERYKKIAGFDLSVRNDELDARLIKFLMYIDKEGISEADAQVKSDTIKDDFKQRADYRPNITIDNGNL